jgi:hypothetical protein
MSGLLGTATQRRFFLQNVERSSIMNRWLIRSVQVAALAMGGLLVTGAAAQADWTAAGNNGLFTGNQNAVHVAVPVNISNNALGLFGTAVSGGGMNNGITDGYDHGNGNGGSNGYGNGNGGANGYGNHRSNGSGGANAVGMGNQHNRHHNNGSGGANAVGMGNQHNRHHNNGSGGANAVGDDTNGNDGSNGNGNGGWTTAGNGGVLTGNRTSIGVAIPITISCNAIGLFGNAYANCG